MKITREQGESLDLLPSSGIVYVKAKVRTKHNSILVNFLLSCESSILCLNLISIGTNIYFFIKQ